MLIFFTAVFLTLRTVTGSFVVVTKACLTLATPWTVAHQAPSVHGISQARMLEWVAISWHSEVILYESL